MTTRRTFGQWLSETRAGLKVTQKDLADAVDVSNTHISNIENDKAGVSRPLVKKIAAYLGVPEPEAVRAWLEDETQEGGAIEYVRDEDTAYVIEGYEGLSDVNRHLARRMIDEMREAEKEYSIGGGKRLSGSSGDSDG
jgi:transcriptional regulator with XRE-family HTH domain